MEKVAPAPFPKLIVIGGSAGALDVLFSVLPKLHESFRLPVVIVLHRKGDDEGGLSNLLAAKSKLTVKEVEDKDVLQPGTIFLAPGDYHLLFEADGTLSLDDSEKVAFSRPSIDVSFQSAAGSYGQSLTGILLSGANSDGTEGLAAIKEYGGITIAQSPGTAGMPTMPQGAISAGVVDFVMDVAGLVTFLNSLGS